MANPPSLLKFNLNSNPLTFNFPPNPSYPHHNSLRFNHKTIRISPKSRINCVVATGHDPKLENPATGGIQGFANDPKKIVNQAFWNVLRALYDHHHHHDHDALAASGGRMGGKHFSSSSSSRSYSSSSSRSKSSSSSSRSKSSSSSSRSDTTGPYYTSSSYAPTTYYASTSSGGGDGFIFVLVFVMISFSFIAFCLTHSYQSDTDDDRGRLTATEETSVVRLQVGLLGSGRSLQTELNQIAEVADTSSPQGLSYVLTETTLALLRHPDYCISGYSSVDLKRSVEEGEERFNQLSIEERGKFDEETLVNVDNIKRQSATSQRSNGSRNEYIVITIIVATGGVLKLPPINSSAQLKEALQKLGSIPSSRIMAVEVLWTPQNENDTLSEQEFLEDYSLLRPL